ncbi:MAG: hypothetical protein R3F43_22125 [bacterium]
MQLDDLRFRQSLSVAPDVWLRWQAAAGPAWLALHALLMTVLEDGAARTLADTGLELDAVALAGTAAAASRTGWGRRRCTWTMARADGRGLGRGRGADRGGAGVRAAAPRIRLVVDGRLAERRRRRAGRFCRWICPWRADRWG